KADWFRPVYDFHSFQVLPRLGRLFAGDADSYRYLAESIRRHPPQEELRAMMEAAGFARARYRNLTGGIVAIHDGWKACCAASPDAALRPPRAAIRIGPLFPHEVPPGDASSPPARAARPPDPAVPVPAGRMPARRLQPRTRGREAGQARDVRNRR